MSSLKKMLAILNVFSAKRPTLPAEEIIASLGYTQPTGYRYIRELCDAGLLSRIQGQYTLGPRIITLDHQIRTCDPLLAAARPVMQGLSARLNCDVLLTVYFGEQVIVSHHERGADPIVVSYGRGHLMPLFRGAASKALISALPNARLKRLFAAHGGEVAAAGLGEDWAGFRTRMAAMQKSRFIVTRGELDAGNVGVSTPVAVAARMPPASLTLVFSEERYRLLNVDLVSGLLIDAVTQIPGELSATAAAPVGA